MELRVGYATYNYQNETTMSLWSEIRQDFWLDLVFWFTILNVIIDWRFEDKGVLLSGQIVLCDHSDDVCHIGHVANVDNVL